MSIFPDSPVAGLPSVAYFCMEYGLDPSLPIYSGGLGILAGDAIKSAGDLRLPFVAIGILWNEGYTVQRISDDGYPWDAYPATSREGLEVVNLPKPVTVKIRGKDVALRCFRTTKFGNAPLYLLEPVDEGDRWITRRLYAGGADDRVAQELVLGVGGVRLLRVLGAAPDVYHFNEGHAVFAGLELIRERRVRGETLADAWKAVRRQIVFTTHTPVPAGNEEHPLARLFTQGADLGAFTAAELSDIGGGDPFGMTIAGLRLARAANAVAELHGETSRAMWKDVPEAAPILSVTNGVHAPTWQDPRIATAYREGTLVETHLTLKRELLAEIRARTGQALDEQKLLVGFARRAATYKRADLIFRDPDVIAPLLASHRVQLVFAGKAHPADAEGKSVIAKLVTMARRFPQAVVFLENYEMALAAKLVRGADVWLNNPRRPLEASGTSGMKAAMNGVMNVSILDGWWPEGCVHGVNGWQIGDESQDLPDQDERDRDDLHRVLVGEVLAAWEQPGRVKWGEMMAASIEMSRHKFSSDRMLEDYVRRLYVA